MTALLVQWSGGDEQALEALMPLVYDELRRARKPVDHVSRREALDNELDRFAIEVG